MQNFSQNNAACVSLIEELLRGEALVCKNRIALFDQIDSTNTYLKTAANSGAPHASAAIAASQTNGRGRLGRSFYSPDQTGIYLSLLYKTEEQITKPAVFTAAAAVAVERAVKKLCGISLGIKWVNDLYLNGQKVCGILCEGVALPEEGLKTIIVGIGVNISTANFPEEIQNKAGSLFGTEKAAAALNGTAQKDFRLVLAAEILNQLFECYKTSNSEEVLGEYKEKSIVLGKNVEVITPKGNYFAKAVDISCNAELIVQKDDGTKTALNSGEISVKPQ